MEEVIEKSDYLLVLSPDNMEMYAELCGLPLQSRKLTYIDKTFADTKTSAETIFKMAEEGITNCYSSPAQFLLKNNLLSGYMQNKEMLTLLCRYI